MIADETWVLLFGLRSSNTLRRLNSTKSKGPSPKAILFKNILLTFTQNDKFGFHGLDRDLARDLLGYASKCDRLRRIRMTYYNGHALVPTFPDFHTQWNG